MKKGFCTLTSLSRMLIDEAVYIKVSFSPVSHIEQRYALCYRWNPETRVRLNTLNSEQGGSQLKAFFYRKWGYLKGYLKQKGSVKLNCFLEKQPWPQAHYMTLMENVQPIVFCHVSTFALLFCSAVSRCCQWLALLYQIISKICILLLLKIASMHQC